MCVRFKLTQIFILDAAHRPEGLQKDRVIGRGVDGAWYYYASDEAPFIKDASREEKMATFVRSATDAKGMRVFYVYRDYWRHIGAMPGSEYMNSLQACPMTEIRPLKT